MPPVTAVFVVWDLIAIFADVWGYSAKYVTGIGFPGVPIEELMFFIVIPLCGLLTYNAVDTIITYLKRRLRDRSAQSS